MLMHTLAAATLMTGIAAGGSVVHVPGDHLTIQDAIDAALDGDTVIVAPGTYTGWANRDLDFAGKTITVRSTDPEDPAIVAATVIDCEQAGRGFLLQSGETSAAVIDGLTITNGFATDGAGVFLLNGSGVTIRNSVLTGNIAPIGGGVIESNNFSVLDLPSTIVIDRCTITGNNGAGFRSIFISTLTVTGSTFAGNTADGLHQATFGSAVTTLTDSTFTGNGGSGAIVQGDLLQVSRCTIADNGNTGLDMTGFFGGISLEVANCTITGNSSESSVGGLICDAAGPAVVRNCTITGNTGQVGGLSLAGFGNFLVTGSTIAGNVATGPGGGGLVAFGTDPTSIENCLLWGNVAVEGAQLQLSSGFNNPAIVSVDFSDLQGGEVAVAVDADCCSPSQLDFGPDNLDADPLFVDADAGDYHVLAGSPAIDGGDPAFIPVSGETDIDGDPRVIGDRVDLGADEFRRAGDLDGDGSVGIIDFLLLLGAWGPCVDCGQCLADLDGDCEVGITDFLNLLGNWG